MPQRIRRRRAKGWRLPPNSRYVGRPTKWGNPFIGDRHIIVPAYREWLLAQIEGRACQAASLSGLSAPPAGLTAADLKELKGRDLACWCPLDAPCHADVLLDLANPEPTPV